MGLEKNKESNSKLSVVLTGLFSLSIGISLFLVNQNRKILKLLKSSFIQEDFKVDFNEKETTVPLTIHHTIHEEDELPTAERRYLTG